MNPDIKKQIERKLQARGDPSRKARGMNKLEQGYAARLDLRVRAGDVACWEFEGIRLRLGEGAYYKPDFLVIRPSGAVELHETKGFWREAARVRIRAAAERYWYFRFVAVKNDRANGWTVEEF